MLNKFTIRFCVASAWLLACATKPQTPAAPVTVESQSPALAVERLQLRVSPLEIVQSGVRGGATSDAVVTVKNVDNAPLVLQNFKLVGDGTDVFELLNPMGVSRTLMPGQTAEATVRFAPSTTAAVGVHRATLQIHLADDDIGPLVDVSGLVSAGQQPEAEPPLAHVVAALGYGMNVGGETLSLMAGATSDEVAVPLFVRANPGPVAVDPVARFGVDGAVDYGIFRTQAATKPVTTPLGQLAAGQHQTLNPDVVGEGEISFDPGAEPFGLYVAPGGKPMFTVPALNKGAKARVYPLKSRNNEAIANAFMVAFDEGGAADFQDYVFVVWNVNPATP